MKVVHFHRKPFVGQYSIEGLFANLRSAMLDSGQEVDAIVAPFHSKGIWRRVASVLWAAGHQGDVNHVTGDVHFLALGLRGERSILTIHDCHSLERLRGVKRWIYKLFWVELPIRRAAIVTAISETTKRELLRHVRVAPGKIEVVPDAVSPTFLPCPRPFNTECPRLLHVGTKCNKNLPRLIEALKGIECTLHIVGRLDDSLRNQLSRCHIRYEELLGLTEAEMYRAYCEADIVCLVSSYEGFGLPILEAQCVERPVVTSNCSSMPEVAGDGACLVDPHSVTSIRTGIERVIADEAYRQQLIDAGRRNRSRFSMSAVAQQYLDLYAKVLPQAKPQTVSSRVHA